MKCKIDSLFHSHPVIRIWLTVWKCYTNDGRDRTMVFAYVPPYRIFLWMPTATWWQRVNFCSLYRFFLFIYKVSNKFMKMIDIILHQQISKLLQIITVIQNQTFFFNLRQAWNNHGMWMWSCNIADYYKKWFIWFSPSLNYILPPSHFRVGSGKNYSLIL